MTMGLSTRWTRLQEGEKKKEKTGSGDQRYEGRKKKVRERGKWVSPRLGYLLLGTVLDGSTGQ